MNIEGKIIGDFDLKLASIENITEPGKDQKYKLFFSCEMFMKNTKKIIDIERVEDVIGPLWKTSFDTEKINKYKHLLKAGNKYKARAAIDSWNLKDSGASGVWFEVLSLEPAA